MYCQSDFVSPLIQDGLMQQMGIRQGDFLIIKSNFFDKWLEKFERKYKVDPNFIWRTDKS